MLPHWEEPPADLPAAIREIKAALRARLAASGRSVDEVFAVVERRVRAAAADIAADKAEGAPGLAGHRVRRHRRRHRAR